MLSAELRIVSDDVETIISSLRPEAGRELPRTRISTSVSGNTGFVMIEADDSTAMRAALNSYLGCIRITENISRMAKVNK